MEKIQFDTGNFRRAFACLGEKLNKMCVYNDLLVETILIEHLICLLGVSFRILKLN